MARRQDGRRPGTHRRRADRARPADALECNLVFSRVYASLAGATKSIADRTGWAGAVAAAEWPSMQQRRRACSVQQLVCYRDIGWAARWAPVGPVSRRRRRRKGRSYRIRLGIIEAILAQQYVSQLLPRAPARPRACGCEHAVAQAIRRPKSTGDDGRCDRPFSVLFVDVPRTEVTLASAAGNEGGWSGHCVGQREGNDAEIPPVQQCDARASARKPIDR